MVEEEEEDPGSQMRLFSEGWMWQARKRESYVHHWANTQARDGTDEDQAQDPHSSLGPLRAKDVAREFVKGEIPTAKVRSPV